MQSKGPRPFLNVGKARQSHQRAGKPNLPSEAGVPRGASGKEPTCSCRRCKQCRFNPWFGRVPWSRKWQPKLSILAWEAPWTEGPLEPWNAGSDGGKGGDRDGCSFPAQEESGRSVPGPAFWVKATWTQEEAPESSLVSEQVTREEEPTSQAVVVNGKGDPPKSRRL